MIFGGPIGLFVLNFLSSKRGVVETPAFGYGDHPRQSIALFQPEDALDGPVILFFHGGSWDSGDPGNYPWFGRAFAKDGISVAIAGYRLAPETLFPGFVEDAAAAFATLRARLGPDRPIFLMGHSAGAQIASLVALDPKYLAAHGLSPCTSIKGLIGISGPYDFLPMKEERYKRIFPVPLRPDSQAVNFTEGRHPPMLLLHGTDDTTVHAEDSEHLAAGLLASDNRVVLKLYEGADHFNIIGAIAPILRGTVPTYRDTLAFLRDEEGKDYPGCG